MVRAIHIGRSARTSAELKALLEVLEALGLEREKETIGGQSRAVSLIAPAGKLSIGLKGSGDLRGRAEGTDLLLEISDPDSAYSLLEKRGLKLIADHHEGNSRLFVVELPGGVKAALFGPVNTAPSALEGELNGCGLRFGIVVGRFNSFITERLLAGALDGLRRTGVRESDIELVRVPGSFEIPAGARTLAQRGEVHAVICLGCLLRGETLHYEVIANEVTRGIGQSAQETGIPHALGVLTCDIDSEIIRLIRTKTVQLVINTITGGTGQVREGIEIQDGFRIRRAAVETGIPCLTSLDTARAVVETLTDASGYSVRPFVEYRD